MTRYDITSQKVSVTQPKGPPDGWVIIQAGGYHVKLTPEQALQAAHDIADVLGGQR